MDYSHHMIARAEHNQMVKSVPLVPEYGNHMQERKNGAGYRPFTWVHAIFITILHLVTK